MTTDIPVEQSDPLVSVPVPRHLLTAVYAFIAERDGKSLAPGSGGDPPAESAADKWEHDWSVEDLTHLLRDHRPSVARVIKVLDVLAAHPDTDISTTELAKETRLSRGELRGAFSGFTRVCRSVRPGIRMAWPMKWSWGPSQQEGLDTETYYTLPARCAERWRQARERRGGGSDR